MLENINIKELEMKERRDAQKMCVRCKWKDEEDEASFREFPKRNARMI